MKPDLQKIIEKFGQIVEQHILMMKNNNELLAENLELMKERDELKKQLQKLGFLRCNSCLKLKKEYVSGSCKQCSDKMDKHILKNKI